MPPERDLVHVLRDVVGRLHRAPALRDIADRAGWSAFHFHRAFHRAVGETPKRYTLRLRLERAAARLGVGNETIERVAASSGFHSHEVFTRAFRRRFGRSPAEYRAIALRDASAAVRASHVASVVSAGPCIGLFHTSLPNEPRRPSMPMLSIERRELQPQPILFVRSRVSRSGIPNAIAEGLGKAFPYAVGSGFAIAGQPFTRYPEVGPGLLTIEVGVRLASAAPGQGDVEAGTLPGGPAAVAMHGGGYDTLHETYAAMEQWILEHGLATSGAPWEVYVTDPADHPDTADWRTEVYWPLRA